MDRITADEKVNTSPPEMSRRQQRWGPGTEAHAQAAEAVLAVLRTETSGRGSGSGSGLRSVLSGAAAAAAAQQQVGPFGLLSP